MRLTGWGGGMHVKGRCDVTVAVSGTGIQKDQLLLVLSVKIQPQMCSLATMSGNSFSLCHTCIIK